MLARRGLGRGEIGVPVQPRDSGVFLVGERIDLYGERLLRGAVRFAIVACEQRVEPFRRQRAVGEERSGDRGQTRDREPQSEQLTKCGWHAQKVAP